MLCFSGRVAVSPSPHPPASGDSHSTERGAYLQAGRAGGGGSTGRGGGERGGVIYTGVRLRTTHIAFLQSSSLLGFCFFLFAKIIILNKCRLFAVLFSSCRRRSWGWVGSPRFHLVAAQTLLLPTADPESVSGEGRTGEPPMGGETGSSDAEHRGSGKGQAGGKTGRGVSQRQRR